MPSHPNHHRPEALGRTKAEALLHSTFCLLTSACALALVQPASAANIVWVSDAPPEAAAGGAFYPAGTGYTDSGFVSLLQGAGHNVIRFNGPNAQATVLSAAEIAALNTNDLIIVGRAAGSGAFQAPQVTNWNVSITKPLMTINAYLARSIRMGWFAGATQPDDTPTTVTALNSDDARVQYIFGGVDMNGNTTANPYDVLADRNTSQLNDLPVAGGTLLATAVFTPDNGPAGTSSIIAEWPAGTPVRGGADILGGYRFYFAAGSRESAAAPNAIPLYTSRENLSPTGESMFIRAVEVALNSGVAPATDPGAPVGFTSSPASTNRQQGGAVTFSMSVTGAVPRIVQWQRDTGDGVTFTNIPGATTAFSQSVLTLTNLSLSDSGAVFRVEASNNVNVASSALAILTVTADTNAPVVLSAGSLDGATITVFFNEPVSADTAEEEGNYILNASSGPDVLVATIQPGGNTVLLELSGPIGATATVDVLNVGDVFGNAPEAAASLVATNLGLIGVDVGTLTPPGTNSLMGGTSFTVTGAGAGVTGTADQLRLVYQNVTGDFDARVRVSALVGPERQETFAKALLVARESTATGAGAVSVFMTPAAPGDNSMATTVRTNTGGATGNLGPTVVPGGLPNGWMRIKRAGNVFTTYRSTDGSVWTELGNITLAYGSSLVVGVGVNSHRSGFVVTGTFNDFKVSLAIGQPAIINPGYVGGIFSGAFLTQSGVNYEVQYKDNLNTVLWSTLTSVTGDGSVKPFSDPGPVSLTGSRYYRVIVP